MSVSVVVAIGVILLLAGAVAYLVVFDGAYEVRRQIRIRAPRRAVFEKVRDFRTWHEWSPWLMHEPDAQVQFGEPEREGGYYAWDGKYVGAGRLTHVSLQMPGRIEQRIEFVRPFRSVCEVFWEFEEARLPEGEEATELAWGMRGRMPFRLRFLARRVASMVEKDYDLGLAFLNARLDPQADTLNVEFRGPVRRDAQRCLCLRFDGSIREMPRAMQEGFPRLAAYLKSRGIELGGAPLTIYRKSDCKKQTVTCDMAFPLPEDAPTEERAGGFDVRHLPGGDYFEVSARGDYRFLELAWHAAMCHVRMKKLKYDKSRPPFEIYANDPRETAKNDLLTSIHLPLR